MTFWKEPAGFSCELTEQVLRKWARILEIGGSVEYFPKQTTLGKDETGSGVVLPYFGNTRTALGENGEDLSLVEFLALAARRQRYGIAIVQRDLGGETTEPRETDPKKRKYGPMTADTARSMHAKNVADLAASNRTGHWNDTANNTAFFAAMAFAAKALDGSEKKIKEEMLAAASPADDVQEKNIKATLASGWESGITQPLTIITIASASVIKRPDMPESVLDGYLGKVCHERLPEFPVAYSWPSVLSSASVVMRPHPTNRANIYTCLVGDVHTGKSQAQERCHYLFNLEQLEGSVLETLKSGSAEGLLDKIGDKQGQPVLWWPDELSHLMEKMQIEHSAFPFVPNSVFYNDRNELTVAGRKKIKFHARLSLEGGVVEANFGDSFGAATTSGVYDRFLFSICPSDFKYSYRPMSGDPVFKVKSIFTDTANGLFDPSGNELQIVTPEIDGSVWDARDEFQKAEGIEPRVAEIAIRCALICAAWDRKLVLRASDLAPHWELARYQMRVRALLRPNPGRNFEGIIALKILDFLKANQDGDKWLPWRDVQRRIRAMEYGPSVAERAVHGLAFAGDIERAEVQNKGGGRARVLVRLAQEG